MDLELIFMTVVFTEIGVFFVVDAIDRNVQLDFAGTTLNSIPQKEGINLFV